MLGATLAAGADDYTKRKLQLEDEARRRANQLADVESARSYEQQNLGRLRTLQLEDEARRRTQGLEDLKTKAQLENRLRLLQEAEARGLFDAKLIGNMVAEDEALGKLQVLLAKEAEFSQGQPGNAQARLDELTQAEREITRKMGEVEARLSAQPTIDPAAVANTALQIATEANGGKQPSREQIEAAKPEAIAKAQQDATMRWYQDKQDASVQYQILSSQLNTIRQQQANLTSTFKVAPKASLLTAGAPPVVAAPVAPRVGNPLASFTDSLDAALKARGIGAPTATSNDGTTVRDVTSAMTNAPAAAVPVLRQARTSILADKYAEIDQPQLATQAKLADVNKQLSRLQTGLNPWEGVSPQAFNPNPQAQGEYMTKLLLQQSALQRQLQEEQAARSKAKTSLLSDLSINTPRAFVPPTYSSPGSLLSDGY